MSIDDILRIKVRLLEELSSCPAAKERPRDAEFLQAAVVTLWFRGMVNILIPHCAIQPSRKGHTTQWGIQCNEGATRGCNCTIKNLMVANQGFVSSIKCGPDLFGQVLRFLAFNGNYKCSTPPETTMFTRCADNEPIDGENLAKLLNIFLRGVSEMQVVVPVIPTSGKKCGVPKTVIKELDDSLEYVHIFIKVATIHPQFFSVRCLRWTLEKQWKKINAWFSELEEFYQDILPQRPSISREITIYEAALQSKQIVFVCDDFATIETFFGDGGGNILDFVIANVIEDGRKPVGDPLMPFNVLKYATRKLPEIKAWGENRGNRSIKKVGEVILRDVHRFMCFLGGSAEWTEERRAATSARWTEEQRAAASDAATARWTDEERAAASDAASARWTDEKRAEASARVDEQSAPEVLESLRKSGEPFWVKTSKSDISASRGQRMYRKKGKIYYRDFPKIQVRHGETVSLDDLCYLDCEYGDNKLMPYSYNTLRSSGKDIYRHKGYLIKTPYGMVSNSEKNGGALLVWYEKTS
jgi:hypothetical protein